MLPGVAKSSPSVFVIVRFANMLSLVSSVSSSVSRSSVTFAVLNMSDVAFALTSAVTRYVIEEFAGRFAVSLMDVDVVPSTVIAAPPVDELVTDVL